jgi:hypothetical protein
MSILSVFSSDGAVLAAAILVYCLLFVYRRYQHTTLPIKTKVDTEIQEGEDPNKDRKHGGTSHVTLATNIIRIRRVVCRMDSRAVLVPYYHACPGEAGGHCSTPVQTLQGRGLPVSTSCSYTTINPNLPMHLSQCATLDDSITMGIQNMVWDEWIEVT